MVVPGNSSSSGAFHRFGRGSYVLRVLPGTVSGITSSTVVVVGTLLVVVL